MNLKTISIVIPSQNMALYLKPLLKSISSSGALNVVQEVIVVNDGSTDETAETLTSLQKEEAWGNRLQVISNSSAQGRFKARQQGAEKARGEVLFLLDTRVLLKPGVDTQIHSLLPKHEQLMGMILIDTEKSIFNLYWDLSHRFLFRKHFEDARHGFELNQKNYEEYTKGTGMLIVDRQLFLDSCAKIDGPQVLADDTLLLSEILKVKPLFVTEKFSFDWEPRQTWKDFIWRIYDRGPGFVQYNIFEKRNKFFYATLGSALFALSTLLGSAVVFGSLWPGLALFTLLGLLSTFLLTFHPLRFLKIAPLHFLVLMTFSSGVIYGFYHCLSQRIRNPQK